MSLAGINFILIPQYVFCAHLAQLNHTFKRVIRRCEVRLCPLSASKVLREFLGQFCAEHTALLHTVTHLNDNVVSKWLLGAVIAQLPVNIWMVTHMMYRKLAIGEKVLLLSLIFTQLYLSLMARKVLLKLTVGLHSSAKYLGKAQTLLAVFQPETEVISCALNYNTTVRAKLKLAAYYEVVHSEQKVYFRLGPLGKLSERGIINVGKVLILLKKIAFLKFLTFFYLVFLRLQRLPDDRRWIVYKHV